MPWGGALAWTVGFKVAPDLPVFVDYVKRITARPSFARAKEKDKEWAKQQTGTG